MTFIIVDRTWIFAVAADPARHQGFIDLIFQDRFLSLVQQGLGLFKAQTQILGLNFVMRTVDVTNVARPRFAIFKGRLDHDPHIHVGPTSFRKP
ncbi:hypothetical protein [Roseobacter weihaiensis]|uniref:hypothetical protein n=1 Tax=Roseobacter weihaiensis TaxID=2763262 RepID=UPI001D0ADF1E|nr:hypothetical protein [Roseobacter sp. H9]